MITDEGGMPQPCRPVKWLDVRQLVTTSVDVLQASSFARFADKREAMAASPREFYTLATPDGATVWIDFVSDTGDGFDATFATARCLSGAARIEQAAAFADRPQRADLLVLGGDEVYPVASAQVYEERFVSVLRRAAILEGVADRPPLLALPGNHDWYDGLGAFRRIFCESHIDRPAGDGPPALPVPPTRQRRSVGGWGAFQSRSYFAVQLVPGWWLWAVDGQLNRPIDVEQLTYFRAARTQLGADDRIVLCTATPSWLEARGEDLYRAPADSPLFTTLWFVDRTLGPTQRHRIRLVLTGDDHHYARYTATDTSLADGFAPELVTCGGGGAFLASTHHLPRTLRFDLAPWTLTRDPSQTGPDDSAEIGYTIVGRYPEARTSRLLGWRRLPVAAFGNGWTLPALLGVLILPLYLSATRAMDEMVRSPSFWIAGAAVLLATFLYAVAGTKEHDGSPSRWPRAVALAALHTAGYAGIVWLLTDGLPERWTAWLRPESTQEDVVAWLAEVGLRGAVTTVVLGVLGALVFALYLQIADHLLCCHTLEAFSGGQIPDYKSHLRLRVTRDRIDVHVVGIARVPRARRAARGGVGGLAGVVPHAHVVESFSVAHTPDAAEQSTGGGSVPAVTPEPARPTPG
ncbi:metallophosphoesterase [Pseudonocardia sp.]|uniref:metallophosphoesterase n=1 Tax=Pseudonocardia sp. TaxID=60912 RepID=UPI003D0A0BB6